MTSAHGSYLAKNLTLKETLTAQFPSGMASFLTSVHITTSTLNLTFFFALVGQLIIRSLLEKIWPYYCTLQLMTLILKYDGITLPVNVALLVNDVDELLRLKAMKDTIIKFLIH